ncbi:hypothetical protein NPIL_686731, partial [Nephila pilipes]
MTSDLLTLHFSASKEGFVACHQQATIANGILRLPDIWQNSPWDYNN